MAESSKIKILIVLNTLGFGGAEVQIARTAPYFDREKFEVQIAYYSKVRQGHPSDMLEKAGVKVTFLDRDNWGKIKYFSRAAQFMKQEGFDIVHAWTGTANLYGRIPALMAGVPGIIGGLLGRRTANGIMGTIYSLTNWRCSGWIVNADDIKRIAEKKLKFIGSSPIYVVPNGIEFDGEERFKRDAKTFYDGIKGARPVVGTVGRLVPVKNIKLFLEMARTMRLNGTEADFWIIGDGPLRSEIEGLIASYNLEDCVKMLGYRKDVDEGIARMDMVVLTSDSEGCPNVLLEGMRASLPVVSTNCTTLEQIVEDGKNGFVVPVGNAAALAEKASAILADPRNKESMGAASHRIIEERFAMPIAVGNLQKVYMECLRRGARGNKKVLDKLNRLGL